MKQFSLSLIFMTVCLFSIFGRVSTDSIFIDDTFRKDHFYQNDKELSLTQLGKIMKPNEQAYKEINSDLEKPELTFGLTGDGVGLSVLF